MLFVGNFRYLPKEDYIIQLWCGGYDYWISDLLRKGYRTIFSNSDAWYLDCGFGAWIYSGQGNDNNWCSPFKSWKTVYMNSPRNLVAGQGLLWREVSNLVLGGEAAMWSEQVDEQAVESRVWPRLSALGERLWSDPPPTQTWQDAERRFIQHRHRIVQRGVRADAVQPEFCRLHDGWCFMPVKKTSFGTGGDMGGEWREQPLDDADTEARSLRKASSGYSLSYVTMMTLVLLGLMAVACRRRICALINLLKMSRR